MIRRFFKSRRANSAVEFALIAPIMIVLMAGIVEFGRAFLVYSAVNRLATRYAVAWADCSDSPTGTCNTELALYTAPAAIRNVVPQLTNPVTLRMFEVSMASGVATTMYAYPVGQTPTAAEVAIAQGAIASGQLGVIVTVTYTHVLTLFPQLVSGSLGPTRTLTYTIAQLKS